MGQMAKAREHVDAQLTILSRLRQVECAHEVVMGPIVTAGVVRHPTGHFGQAGRGGETAGLSASKSPPNNRGPTSEWRYFTTAPYK